MDNDEQKLTEQEFRQRVKEKQDVNEPEIAVKRACDLYAQDRDEFSNSDVNEASLLTMIISGCSFSYLYDDVQDRYLWTTDKISVVPPEELSDDTLLQSDRVLDELTPRTKRTRERIFGEVGAPFDEYEAGIGWIREQVESSKSELDEEKWEGDREKLEEQIMELAIQYRNDIGDVDIQFSMNSIRYFVLPDSKIFSIDHIPPGTRLDPLLEYLNFGTKKTGFTEPALLLFFLTGARPILPRWKLTKQESEELDIPASFRLNLHADNITTQDFQRIHRKIKELKDRDNVQPFKEKDRILITVVDGLGGVPDEGIEEFWQEVYQRCKEKGIQSWGSSNAAKMRWRRLQERLE